MKKERKIDPKDELRPEYDLAQLKGGVRGKYVKRYRAGTNLVCLEADVARVFADDQIVNETLRSLIKIAKTRVRHAHLL